MKGCVYIRDNNWYKFENVVKMGISKTAKTRNSSYVTGEVIRGEYICVIEIPLSKIKQIDNNLKMYFKSHNIYKGGGTEFYSRDIIKLIVPYFEKHETEYNVLSSSELYALNNRIEKIDLNNFMNINNNMTVQNNIIETTIINSNIKHKNINMSASDTDINTVTNTNTNNLSNKSRTYEFKFIIDGIFDWHCIDNYYNSNKNILYICAYENNGNVTGFIRYKNPITMSTVKNILCEYVYYDVYLIKKINDDKYYKSLLVLYSNKYENGIPCNKEVKNNNLITPLMLEIKSQNILIEKQQNQIAQIVNKIQTQKSNRFCLKSFLASQKNSKNICDFINKLNIDNCNHILKDKNAVLNILNNSYTLLNVDQRPFHCTDLKRKIFYVYHEYKWIPDKSCELLLYYINLLYSRVNEICMNNNMQTHNCINNDKLLAFLAKLSYIDKNLYINNISEST